MRASLRGPPKNNTIVLSFTVGAQYDAAAVKDEINYLLPYIESELFNTLESIDTAPVFIVWSQDKAGGARTYTELCAHEKAENGSVSTRIVTHDIEAFLNAAYNETDIDLKCIEIVRAK